MLCTQRLYMYMWPGRFAGWERLISREGCCIQAYDDVWTWCAIAIAMLLRDTEYSEPWKVKRLRRESSTTSGRDDIIGVRSYAALAQT